MQEVYDYLIDYINELREDIDYEQYKELWDIVNKLKNNENGNVVFVGEDSEHYKRWISQIKEYVELENKDFNYTDDFIIKIALSYTLQSLRSGESLKRFQWGDNCMIENNDKVKVEDIVGIVKTDEPTNSVELVRRLRGGDDGKGDFNHSEGRWFQRSYVFECIDKKIEELEKLYEFGQNEYSACPMNNILYGINTLKELKKELE